MSKYIIKFINLEMLKYLIIWDDRSTIDFEATSYARRVLRSAEVWPDGTEQRPPQVNSNLVGLTMIRMAN